MDADAADAVLFADEAEMVACLIRDWLRGRLADRWWWRCLLAGADPMEWVQRNVLSRGEVLPPALAMLPASEACAWVSRLPEADSRMGVAAVARSYALPSDEPLPALDKEAGVPAEEKAAAPRMPDGIAGEHDMAALARLLSMIPELRSGTLRGPEARRLLAFALVVMRAPSWARTPQFAVAARALEHAKLEAVTEVARPAQGARPGSPARPAAMAQAWGDASGIPGLTQSWATRAGDFANTEAPRAVPAASVRRAPWKARGGSRQHVRSAEARLESGDPHTAGIAQGAKGDPGTDALVREAHASQETSGVLVGANMPGARLDVHPLAWSVPPHAILTQFGGTFYLLNAAIALELYSDFSAPRGPNLALSPWDWLALVGSSWFGEPFETDPVWNLLAGLAGRGPEQKPGRDVDPVSGRDASPAARDAWVAAMLLALRDRLASALDPGGDEDLPARVCRHDARVHATASDVDVHLSLADLPLDIRIAGLDRDPGWIPAAGRAVRFHFD
ncbi:MAG TPA: hypothetical protein VFJ62_02590 [Usitatibacter sp.]|nr:hypothetical protein [Usitatibacter sp.]